MESVATQRENLRQYREQLQAVDDGLRAGGASAEEREELEALRAELVDVIALTEELIAGCVDGEGASAGIAEASAGVAGAELAEPKLESAVGFDFVPLMTALKAQDFLEADQLTHNSEHVRAPPAAFFAR